jgi:hypothetical protein
MSQGNSLYNYLKQTKMSFFAYKNEEQEGRIGPVWGVGTSGSVEDIRKGYRGVNIVEILCTHI